LLVRRAIEDVVEKPVRSARFDIRARLETHALNLFERYDDERREIAAREARRAMVLVDRLLALERLVTPRDRETVLAGPTLERVAHDRPARHAASAVDVSNELHGAIERG
jgi:hypothetical protein